MPISRIEAPMPDPTAVAEWFRRRRLREAERPALSFGDSTLSYGELYLDVERMSAMLAASGVGRGDRVGYVGFNDPVVVILLFASARLGAIFVPLSFRLSPPELVAIIGDAGIHTLVVDEASASSVDLARPALHCTRYVLKGAARPGWDSLHSLIDAAPVVPAQVTMQADDVVVLMYTSGTTGQPKGVTISNRNIWAANLNSLLFTGLNADDVTLVCAPLFHAAALYVLLVPSLMVGAHVVLQKGFEAAGLLDALERQRVTMTVLVPAMMLFASQHERFASADLSAMRLIISGGAPAPQPLLKTWEARGIPVSQCYGMTESTALATVLEMRHAITRLGSCGRAAPLTDLRVVDVQGRDIVEAGLRGEVWLRGDHMTRGYWNRPAETAAAFHEGWYRSGDAAYRDADGFVYICDRLKDMIISGGENIYPAEVESVLYAHPAIAEVAVIGAPDDRWGEHVVAVAVLKAGASLDLEALRVFAGTRLARYKLPSELLTIDVLPRNSAGKLLKTELRRRFGQPATEEPTVGVGHKAPSKPV